MKVAVFNARNYDREFLTAANNSHHELRFFEPHLNEETAGLAAGFGTVCVFVNDRVDAAVIAKLDSLGVQQIALRCAGYNNVDLKAAAKCGMTVVRVPGYSPYAVAEHTVGLMLALNRKLHRAYNRVREGNFSLEGLLGFDMRGRTVGIIGTGKIGTVIAQILTGLSCRHWRSIRFRMKSADLQVCVMRNWTNCSHSRTSSRCTVRSHRRTGI